MTLAAGPGGEQRSAPPALRTVALPREHGGWGLTAEPVVLGLALAPSVAGALLGLAAFTAFLARTPLRVVLVDHHRHRELERTRLARWVVLVELAALVCFAVGALVTATSPFWWPAAVALPLVAVELWFDLRSKSRRLAPELAGAVGIGSVAAMIVLADGCSATVAVAAWAILVARNVTAIPHVRAQIDRAHHRSAARAPLVVADLVAVAVAAAAAIVDRAFVAGAGAVVVAIPIQRLSARREVPAKVIGIRQTLLGLAIVVVTAAGVHLG